MLDVIALLATISAPAAASAIATISDATNPPPGWVAVPPPKTEREWLCANYADDLRIEGAGTSIRVFRDAPHVAPALVLANGTLVGVNKGEFGGAIEWHAQATKTVTIVAKDNPVAFVAKGARVFALAGLAHLTMDEGHILELKQTTGGKWSSKKVLDLDAAPDAVLTLAGGDILVLTTRGLVRVNLDTLAKRRVFDNPRWSFLYASSIAQLADSIFVGARSAVIRLRPGKKGYVEEWWVESKCRRMLGDRCECQP